MIFLFIVNEGYRNKRYRFESCGDRNKTFEEYETMKPAVVTDVSKDQFRLKS